MLAQNDDLMPQFNRDCKELLLFKTWAASGWVRVMFYLSLITTFVTCILAMIYVGYYEDSAFIFFAVVAILVFCIGSAIYTRIFFEAIMGCLQIPRLIFAAEKLETAMRQDYENRSSVGVQVIDDNTSQI